MRSFFNSDPAAMAEEATVIQIATAKVVKIDNKREFGFMKCGLKVTKSVDR